MGDWRMGDWPGVGAGVFDLRLVEDSAALSAACDGISSALRGLAAIAVASAVAVLVNVGVLGILGISDASVGRWEVVNLVFILGSYGKVLVKDRDLRGTVAGPCVPWWSSVST